MCCCCRWVASVSASVMMLSDVDMMITDNIAQIDCSVFWHRLGISWHECNRLWLVKDACGIICAAFAWLLIAYAEFVVMIVILLPSDDTVHSIINTIIFHFFTALAIAAHLRTMLSDPVMLAFCQYLICSWTKPCTLRNCFLCWVLCWPCPFSERLAKQTFSTLGLSS